MKKIALGVVSLVPFAAMAAVPESVTTAISTTQADAVTVAGLMIGVTAALLVFKYIRRLMK